MVLSRKRFVIGSFVILIMAVFLNSCGGTLGPPHPFARQSENRRAQSHLYPYVGILTYNEAVSRFGQPTNLINYCNTRIAIWTKFRHSRPYNYPWVRTQTCEIVWNSDKLIFDMKTGKLLDLDTIYYVQLLKGYCFLDYCGTCNDLYSAQNHPKPPKVWPCEDPNYLTLNPCFDDSVGDYCCDPCCP